MAYKTLLQSVVSDRHRVVTESQRTDEGITATKGPNLLNYHDNDVGNLIINRIGDKLEVITVSKSHQTVTFKLTSKEIAEIKKIVS